MNVPLLGDIGECAVFAELEETVGNAAGLADVYLILAIIIDISDGDAITAIDVYAGGRIEAGTPVRNAARELLGEYGGSLKGSLRDITEVWLSGDGGVLFQRG